MQNSWPVVDQMIRWNFLLSRIAHIVAVDTSSRLPRTSLSKQYFVLGVTSLKVQYARLVKQGYDSQYVTQS